MHALDRHPKRDFDRFLDLRFIRAFVNLERVLRLFVSGLPLRLFSHKRSFQNFVWMHFLRLNV
jgi:hypothetical protein